MYSEREREREEIQTESERRREKKIFSLDPSSMRSDIIIIYTLDVMIDICEMCYNKCEEQKKCQPFLSICCMHVEFGREQQCND